MTVRYRVKGAVQGVGFRWFVARHARMLGLAGYAQNLSDGSVEVVATGAVGALEELEVLLREGPASARVEEVTTDPVEADTVPIPAGSFDIL